MPYRLLRFGWSRKHPEPRMFTHHESLKPAYDVVIIGAGGHGLASAYYLARDHGIRNVAVLEKGYIGGGKTRRHTDLIRSHFPKPGSVQLHRGSGRLLQGVGGEFGL